MPAQLYRPSRRPYTGLSDLEYPFHDRTITLTQCGRTCIGRRKINLSQVFAGQNVGIKEFAEKIWLIWIRPHGACWSQGVHRASQSGVKTDEPTLSSRGSMGALFFLDGAPIIVRVRREALEEADGSGTE
jgi:hypothetical protein